MSGKNTRQRGCGMEDMSRARRQDRGIWRTWRTRDVVLAVLWLCGLWPACMGIKAKIPLVSEEVPESSLHRNEPGCLQDGKHYRLEERWSPVLIPRGKMHCVKCECLTVEKKGIIQPRGRVKCKNIKGDCPKPQCDHPVLLPERCCKICPGSPDKDFESNFSFRPSGQVTGIYSDDQLQQQHKVNEFRGLLVGRQVRGRQVRTRSVAVIHITASGEELRYAVRYSRLDRPRLLQITDANGYVLLDTPIRKRRKKDKRLCGVWTKIPPVYVQYFREGRLFAVITSSHHPRGLLAGRVGPHDMAATEVFSTVLSSPTAEGTGGLASFEYHPPSRTLSYVIHVDGLVDTGMGAEYYVTISRKTRVLHQSSVSTTPLATKIAGSWKLSKKRERKQLARGRLRLRVASQNGAMVSGTVYPRLICGVFQAVLSGSNALEKNEAASAGSAIVELSPSGKLEYKVHVVGLQSPVTRIRLEANARRRKQKPKKRIVGTLHRSFVTDNSSFDGWANGTFKKLEAKDIYNLLNNKLFINIATARRRISQLRGRLVQAPYHNQQSTPKATALVTLRPHSPEARGGAAHVWLSMSAGCSLRYDAVLAGFRHRNEVEDVGSSFSVLLGTFQNRLHRTFLVGPVPGHLVTRQFEYNISSGSVDAVPQELVKDLDQGQAFLLVVSGPDDKAIFRGNVTVPNTCWQYVQDLDSSVAVEERGLGSGDPRQVCLFEGSRYHVGDTWLPDVNASCFTCSCLNGAKAVCHEKPCPPLPCANPVQLDNECCPTCPEETWSEFCEMSEDPRKYPLHHTWHPFLPLIGFAKCAVCTCKSGNKIECGKIGCPPLHCPGHQLIRRNPDDCCPVCGPKLEKKTTALELPQLDINMEGACNFLGQWKADGSTWHPRVQPFGHLKCFVCHCRAGKSDCGRTECPVLTCPKTKRSRDSCCPHCDDADTDEHKSSNRSCQFGDKSYEHGADWRPSSSLGGSTRCARCTCQNGEVNCKIRCPRKCQTDRNYSECCRHCPEDRRAKSHRARSDRDRSHRARSSRNRKQKGQRRSDRKTRRRGFPLT
ncbi:chordin-like isoform X2 [Babylonia areolata]|uniref:chordin-like isoform X2 n=1 Tax=Babylonia areolata TaxID=304850 RepID=UPI003FD459F6